MANGDVIENVSFTPGQWSTFRALDAQTATTTGQWVATKGFARGTLDLQAPVAWSGVTVQVQGSNAEGLPSDTVAGNLLTLVSNGTSSQSITSAGTYRIDSLPCRYIKVVITAYTSGTVTGYLHLTTP